MLELKFENLKNLFHLFFLTYHQLKNIFYFNFKKKTNAFTRTKLGVNTYTMFCNF